MFKEKEFSKIFKKKINSRNMSTIITFTIEFLQKSIVSLINF